VAPSSDENENCMALLKGISLLKMLKAPSKLIHKPRHNDRLNYAPCRTHSPPDRSVTEKKNKHHAHFRTYSWRALFDLPQALHGGRAHRAHLKRCQPFFDPIHSFSARGQNIDFWLLSKNKYREVAA